MKKVKISTFLKEGNIRINDKAVYKMKNGVLYELDFKEGLIEIKNDNEEINAKIEFLNDYKKSTGLRSTTKGFIEEYIAELEHTDHKKIEQIKMELDNDSNDKVISLIRSNPKVWSCITEKKSQQIFDIIYNDYDILKKIVEGLNL